MAAVEAHGERTRGSVSQPRPFVLVLASPPQPELLNGRPFAARRSTGSSYGFLFSVPWEVEGFCQLQGGLVERQLVYRRPQVQHVALSTAVGVEALEDVLAQMGREGRLRVAGLAVNRARPAALQAAAAQAVE